jgi:multiple sugar transport system substrate-binding protein
MDNFEALEAVFDRFNEIYPNVQLSYVKLDDYNNILATYWKARTSQHLLLLYLDERKRAIRSGIHPYGGSFRPCPGAGLACVRPSLLSRDAGGRVLMVPFLQDLWDACEQRSVQEGGSASRPHGPN